MNRTPSRRPAVWMAVALCVAGAKPARAFLGFADTSFVTVIANPAEAADWASQLESLSEQLAAAESTLQTVEQLRAFAGDPRAAVAALADLGDVSGVVAELTAGSQTEDDLRKAWEALSEAAQTAKAAALLAAAGPGTTMQVFGQTQSRNEGLYTDLARDVQAAEGVRGQIAQEQTGRRSVASELALAWSRFRSAATESDKQAILAEIGQLQSQDEVMGSRRRALLDDLELSDREERARTGARDRAGDEQALAESALLNAGVEGRLREAESQRIATLQKTAAAPDRPDYTGLRLWTTSDAAPGPP
ncbi:MAG TPA: hypothetical protein VGF85_09505 [Opitutaceae bacterium]